MKSPARHYRTIKTAVRKTIDACYDDLKDWRMDPRAYVLIRINPKLQRIEVGIVDPKTHTVHTQVNGKDAREIYHTIARMDAFSYSEHYGYLGRELMKAQIALRMGISYTQDSPLPLPKLRKDAF
jgi:hypothetical protein